MSASSLVKASSPLFLITHEFYPVSGGIATFAEEIAKASAGLGYDVEVWAQSAPASVEKKWPFRIRRLPLKGTHDLICQFRLACQLVAKRRQLRNATVYLPEPGPMMTMMLLQFFQAFRPKRLVLTFHGSEIIGFAKSPLRRWLAGKLIRHATRVSTLTTYTQELFLLERFPHAADKIFLTPGALRTDFAVVQGKTARDQEKIVVLTVGRLHPRKGQLITLQALQMLPPEVRRKIEYWIVGGRNKGNYEAKLRSLAASDHDLTVRFFGNIPDEELAEVYERSDIFALTSVSHGHSVEGFGLVYLEAAAHSLPIVAHNIGGVSEAVRDGVTGLLVTPERPAELAAAFEKLIHDASLRKRLGGRRKNLGGEELLGRERLHPVREGGERLMIRSRVEVTVRYAETDMMGIVYHANYLPWFEVGRTTLLKEIGVPYKKLEEEGFRLPVLEISARYLRPAVYDDTLEILTTVTDKPLLRIRLEYEVKRGGELLATGTSVHAFVDTQGKPVRPPAWAAEVLAKAFA